MVRAIQFKQQVGKAAEIADTVYQFLTPDGAEPDSDSQLANGDYSDDPGSGPTQFYRQVPSGKTWLIHRMIVQIEDAASGFNADTYGGISALTNGILVQVRNPAGAVARDLTDGVPIRANSHWARYCYDTDIDAFGAGSDFFSVRWTFANSGSPLRLLPGWRFNVLLNDDLQGLLSHTFQIQGFGG
jgi:hypothetical protein